MVREITNVSRPTVIVGATPDGWAIRRFAGVTITTSVKVCLDVDPDGPFFLLNPDAATRLEQMLGGQQ